MASTIRVWRWGQFDVYRQGHNLLSLAGSTQYRILHLKSQTLSDQVWDNRSEASQALDSDSADLQAFFHHCGA